jgi:hypothetical protein
VTAGPLLKGAFVAFTDTFLVPMPNVVVFQFNPDTMTHSWTQPEAVTPEKGEKSNPLAVRGVPGETFRFDLVLDAGDMIADGGPVGAALGEASGVYSRLAAIEMLQFPLPTPGLPPLADAGLVGTKTAADAAAAAGADVATERPVPQSQVPTVLFVWGPGRILPIRVADLSVTEQLYDALLNPTQATASITVSVLTPDELAHVSGPLARIARAAYMYSLGLRQTLALANLGGPAQSFIGMLPL